MAESAKGDATYAEHGAPHLWLIDPAAKTHEIFRLQAGGGLLRSVFGESDKERAEPFVDIEIELTNLWID